jgi:hypothetical protein
MKSINTTTSKQQFTLGGMKAMALSVVLLTFAVMSPMIQAGYASSPTYYDVNAQSDVVPAASTNSNSDQPKESYNKRRRIKGELKRRTLTNDYQEVNTVQQEEAAALNQKGNDNEDLEHFLRYLQFSTPVRFI